MRIETERLFLREIDALISPAVPDDRQKQLQLRPIIDDIDNVRQQKRYRTNTGSIPFLLNQKHFT